VLRRRGKSPTAYLLLALAGLAIALGILLEFLLPQHAFGPFFFILSKLVPYYSSLAHPTLWVLIRRSIPQLPGVFPLATAASPLRAEAGERRNAAKDADWDS